MKKLFFFAAALVAAVTVDAQMITFGTVAIEKTNFGATRTFTNGAVTLTVDNSKEPTNKFAIDANNAYFGTDLATAWKGEWRLKTNGKSQVGNGMTLTVPAAGVVKVYARTGSNSAVDRNIVLTQNGTEILNVILKEEDAKSFEDGTDETGAAKFTKVYPIYSASVSAGEIVFTYPVNGINFYAIEFDSQTALPETTIAPKAQKVMENGQLIIIKNGVKYNALGAVVE